MLLELPMRFWGSVCSFLNARPINFSRKAHGVGRLTGSCTCECTSADVYVRLPILALIEFPLLDFGILWLSSE